LWLSIIRQQVGSNAEGSYMADGTQIKLFACYFAH
jgi:hypothetical protein